MLIINADDRGRSQAETDAALRCYHLCVIRTGKCDALSILPIQHRHGLNYPKALPFCPAYASLGHVPKDFPVAYANQSRILSLPIYPAIKDEMIRYVVECIESFFSHEPAGAERQPEEVAAR
jgi:dTDP-4-amino-4,6-dideoxygalactose transaminase